VESKPETGEAESLAVERKPAELMSPKEFREAGLGTANDVAVLSALRDRKPVSALAVDEYHLKHALPKGYRRDGDVFLPPGKKVPSSLPNPHAMAAPESDGIDSKVHPAPLPRVTRRKATAIKLSA
jgi:hypothetical protein